MLINAPSNTNRTKILEDEYFKLLQSGVSAENILVLVQNSHKKKEFINEIKSRFSLGSIGNLKIYSFSGLIYNYILENWALIENSIKNENRKIIASYLVLVAVAISMLQLILFHSFLNVATIVKSILGYCSFGLIVLSVLLLLDEYSNVIKFLWLFLILSFLVSSTT